MPARAALAGEQGGPAQRRAALALQGLEGRVVGLAQDVVVDDAAASVAHPARQFNHLLERGHPRRHRLAVEADMRLRHRGGERDRAGAQPIAHDGAHLRDLGGGGMALDRLFAHHVQPQWRVADHHRGVDRSAAGLDGVEVLRKGLEWPIGADAGFQRRQAHRLDPLEGAQDQAAALRPGWREAEAAGAHHDRGHPMPGRHGQQRVPEHLRIIVGMDIDKSRRHHPVACVDDPPCFLRRIADRDDASVFNADIATASRSAAAVDDRAAGDLEVVHAISPLASR